MKLRLGLLMTGLMLAQIPMHGVGTAMTPAQEKAALLQAAAAANLPAAPKIAGITPDQQQKYDDLLKEISTIAAVMDEQVIPLIQNVVAKRDVGFEEGLNLIFAAISIIPAIVSAISDIQDLDSLSPDAKAIVKANLEKTFKAAKFDALIKRFDGLVNLMPAGFFRDKLSSVVVPKLNKIPALIAQLI